MGSKRNNMRYIGCKNKLLDNIEEVINANCKDCKIFCDIFSGTGTVAEHFKTKFSVISNDYLYFSYVIQCAKLLNNQKPVFTNLKKIINENPFDYLDNIDSKDVDFDESLFFIKNNYSDYGNRPYLTKQNAEKIDKWRITIERWKNSGLLSESEYYYLVACVVETVPFYSNISGTYGAFLKTWDRRALKEIKLERLNIVKSIGNNKCFNKNSDELVNEIKGDILYLDPPYNERQYLPNYHLLETVAKYDYPDIHGVTGIRGYSSQKSLWCQKKYVKDVFENMVSHANFRYIILSYNTDGIMTVEEIENIMSKYAKEGVKTYHIDYNRFKSRTLVNQTKLEELIFIIEKK